MKPKYYSLKEILKHNATYNVIFGERSNGKTYALLKYGLENYIKNGHQMAYLRRWQDDFKGKRGSALFSALVSNDVVKILTKGQWDNIYYYSSRWYLAKWDDKLKKMIYEDTPFCYAFAISAMEHDKSASYPKITTIVFDEFLTRGMYIPDEFVAFMNTISTIIRYRNNVKIFMLGNTVNKYSPYFKEMGLTNITKMKQGTIDVYRYGDTELTVAVEYADSISKFGKPSDDYFAFNNPKLNMITGGAWELALYPHCPCKYKPNEIVFIYFIKFEDELLQCEIIQHDDTIFTFIHEKTTELKDTTHDLIFTPEHSHRPNYRRKITKPRTEIEKKIAEFYIRDKVFFADNEVGEVVRNYLSWCKTDSIK